ncbi:Calcineurin-like phosphoesterase [Planctomycetes bacterium MalM25]|nr:Calcineurin-like phosphoesterase [Planctomycetes bacterium MalM25]
MMLARQTALVPLITAVVANVAAAHQGPDPIAHWSFNSRSVSDGVCKARLGADLRLEGDYALARDAYGEALDLTGWNQIASEATGSIGLEGADAFTVSAWVLIDEAERWGGVVGQHGEDSPLWVLGYDSERFTFSLTTVASDQPVEVRGETPYGKGKWFHVAAVYDGESARLYVNGQLDAKGAASGKITTTDDSVVVLGSRPDHPDSHPMRGRLREVSLYDLAAKPAWVAHTFDHGKQLVSMQRDARADALTLVVKPYLQFGTQTGMTVMWQTSAPGDSVVHYGPTADCEKELAAEGVGPIHEVRIEGLEPETQYFYRTVTTDTSGRSIESRVSTFSTAVHDDSPFAFAIISDTQTNADIAHRVATHAWAQRPSFLLHPGDLVETGTNDSHWTQHFFPSLDPLISRVPFYPVLGNHEQNASNYYEYVSLPDPEYYYEFRYGNAHFFMIDTNRNVDPSSEQHRWLDRALAASDATWKFVCHHHPPYSSDENDYGDLWQTSQSTRGDLRARQLSKLYDKHSVDIVWNGHIHSYERTWPVRDGKAVDGEGPIYMIVGGGGGGLETPGPTRPFFQNQVRRAHHYVMVHINGPNLELRSYDLDDRLFDTVQLRARR